MYTVKQMETLNAFRTFVGSETFTKAQYSEFSDRCSNLGLVKPRFLIKGSNPVEKVSRGVYRFPSSDSETTVSPVCETHQITPAALAEKAAEIPATAANLMMVTDVENMVPERFNGFVPWGHFRDIKNIMPS